MTQKKTQLDLEGSEKKLEKEAESKAEKNSIGYFSRR